LALKAWDELLPILSQRRRVTQSIRYRPDHRDLRAAMFAGAAVQLTGAAVAAVSVQRARQAA